MKYFEWCDDNELKRSEVVKYKGGSSLCDVPLKRIYTLHGLSLFIGTTKNYITNREKDLKEKIDADRATDAEHDVYDVIQWIREVVSNQQIEGAAAGLFHAAVVCRMQGLTEKVQVDSNHPSIKISVTDNDTIKALKDLDDLL